MELLSVFQCIRNAGETEYKELSAESVYMKLFTRDYISRPFCENCSFKGCSRSSDITLGDFWGIWDISPEMDDDKGTSGILIQSAKGVWGNETEYSVQVSFA